jgi:TolB-like protein/DNA-binding winged helix-turn-helix (wHTH) protein/Flp pilus assembly protein TadD
MNNEFKPLREFGKCRLDVEKKFLWCDDQPVQLPLKAIELLCVLVESGGTVVTKDEIWQAVWQNSFVEETNLTHNIYVLRKTFKDLGEPDLIQTVPRRGYRFAGEVREAKNGSGEIVIERQALTQTLIEDVSDEAESETQRREETKTKRKFLINSSSLFHPFALSIIAVLLVALLGGFAYWRYNRTNAGNVSGIKSIAVLPFKTIDSNKENSYHGLGLADILITRLSNIKEINVRPTSAVTAYENQEIDLPQIGEKLNVDAILEGTIYRTADKVRVTARLIKTSDNAPIWAAQFEKPLQDELRLQDEIALQVVDALALNLSGNEKNALTKRYTESADAHQLYVKGRYEWNKRSPAGMYEADRLFRNAIEKDPNFALAYVGLADRMVTNADAGEAWTLINKALELDPNLAEAYATNGFLITFHDGDWQYAEGEFKKSIELNPGYATAHHWYATLLAIQGRTDEAKSEMHRALEINPMSYNFLADLGQLHYFAREYDKAEEYCRKALKIYPEFVFAHEHLYQIYLQTGEYDKAVDEQLESLEILTTFAGQTDKQKEAGLKSYDGLRAIYQQGGIRKYLESLMTIRENNTNIFYRNAQINTFLGDKEKALDNLEKAFESKAFLMVFVKADPLFDSLRSEPRYQEILRKMNL